MLNNDNSFNQDKCNVSSDSENNDAVEDFDISESIEKSVGKSRESASKRKTELVYLNLKANDDEELDDIGNGSCIEAENNEVPPPPIKKLEQRVSFLNYLCLHIL